MLPLLLLLVTVSAAPPSTLKHVSIVMRHGHRGPLFTYEGDPYPYTNETIWPRGKGQLTERGKEQTIGVGQFLRSSYDGFISKEYLEEEVYICHNLDRRDEDTALWVSTGLYFPAQPAPTHFRSFDVADLLRNATLCPRYLIELRKEFHKRTEEERKSTEDLKKYFSEQLGRNVTNSTDLISISDPTNMQLAGGLILPSWLVGKINELNEVLFPQLKQATADNEIVLKLSAGVLMEFIASYMKKGLDGTNKLYVEAAHDVTLVEIVAALNPDLDLKTPTASFIVFELHERNGEDFVEVYFYSSWEETGSRIPVVQCGEPCSWSKFSSLVDSWAPQNFTQECQGTPTPCTRPEDDNVSCWNLPRADQEAPSTVPPLTSSTPLTNRTST